MRTQSGDILKQNKIIAWLAVATGLMLLVPLVAMQFTSEVDWGPLDFIIMGMLIFGTGLAFVLAARKTEDALKRVAIGVVLALAFLLIWAELAVGVFGTPFAGS